MTWQHLLFAHWPVAADALRPLVPPTLELDTFEGRAWVGVIPFSMTGVRPRLVPPLPWVSRFLELNVRTYVTGPPRDSKPGVYFFSLDAANPIAVATARWRYRLPYFNARMRLALTGDEVRYTSDRTHRGAPSARLEARYRPVGPEFRAPDGSIDEWLTARYCLYTVDAEGAAHRAVIHHDPWPLQPATAEIATNTMAQAAGIVLEGPPTHLHFVRRLDVVAWSLERTSAGEASSAPARVPL
jgi:uncharacterized protein YqjF (DUF2071 family)